MKIKIALIEDQQIVREGLVRILNSNTDFEVVLESNNGINFFEKLNQFNSQIDVVLLDLQMPIMDGYEVCEKLSLSYNSIKKLVLSHISTKQSVNKAVINGANGYLTKGTNEKELEKAIKRVYHSDYYFEMALSETIKDLMLDNNFGFLDKKKEHKQMLSKREIEILKLICKEYNSREIANFLNLNHRTIETHRKRIMEKTGAKNFIGAIVFVLQNNIIDLDSLLA